MAKLSYEEFEKFNNRPATGGTQQRASIRYFSLKDDGDTAVVRFDIHSLADMPVSSVHTVESNEDGKIRYRTVNCLRESANSPIDACPLCKAGKPIQFRIFLPLISYNQDDNGNIVGEACVWPQGTKIRSVLKSFIEDYGDLSNMLFKVTRHGARGDKATTYTILPANPNVYKDTIYVKDFSAFDNEPEYLERFVHTKSIEDMEEFLSTGGFPNPFKKGEQNQVESVQPQTAPQQSFYQQQPLTSSAPIVGSVTPAVSGPHYNNAPMRQPSQQPSSGQPKPVRRYTY